MLRSRNGRPPGRLPLTTSSCPRQFSAHARSALGWRLVARQCHLQPTNAFARIATPLPEAAEASRKTQQLPCAARVRSARGQRSAQFGCSSSGRGDSTTRCGAGLPFRRSLARPGAGTNHRVVRARARPRQPRGAFARRTDEWFPGNGSAPSPASLGASSTSTIDFATNQLRSSSTSWSPDAASPATASAASSDHRPANTDSDPKMASPPSVRHRGSRARRLRSGCSRRAPRHGTFGIQ